MDGPFLAQAVGCDNLCTALIATECIYRLGKSSSPWNCFCLWVSALLKPTELLLADSSSDFHLSHMCARCVCLCIFIPSHAQVRVYDLANLSLKFERHLDAEVVDFQVRLIDCILHCFVSPCQHACAHTHAHI